MDSNKGVATVFVSALIGLSLNLWAIIYRHQQVDHQFCALDSAITKVFQQSLTGVTLAEAKKNPGAYERARIQYDNYIIEFAKLAPCDVSYSLPPDLLKP